MEKFLPRRALREGANLQLRHVSKQVWPPIEAAYRKRTKRHM